MSALDRANEFQVAVKAMAVERGITLPTFEIVQTGTAVIARDGLVIAASNLMPNPNFDMTQQSRSAPAQKTRIVGAIARDYETTDQDGVDIPSQVAAASLVMEADGDLLWDTVWLGGISPYLGPDNVSVEWNITGLIVITSVQYDIGTSLVG